MILIDTSVLIDFFKGNENSQCKLFQKTLDQKLPFGITKLIFLEILQGAKTKKEFNLLRDYLTSIPMYDLVNDEESSRKAGITVRSTIDLIIVEIAIENDLYLLHNERDFENIASVINELKILKNADLAY